MLLEAVPNLSLGPGDPLLEALEDRLHAAGSPAWGLLDVHADEDHNRAVLTLAGAPSPLLRGLSLMVDAIAEEGSLVGHEGVHPRVGLVDVVPVVPLWKARVEDAERVARGITARLARHGVPVYGYGEVATRAEHRALAGIRRRIRWAGEAKRLAVPPDAGPGRFHEHLGAACVGVRKPLIAYNVLLDTRDVDLGRRIAKAIRAREGGLVGVQALAFQLASRDGRVQVSTNVTDVEATQPADVYRRVEALAADAGVDVLGGEIVGLAPRAAIPDDPGRIGLEARPAALEDRLAARGLPSDLASL